MKSLQQSFAVTFAYNVYFTASLFDVSNKLLTESLGATVTDGSNKKIFFVVDSGVVEAHPYLLQNIKSYFTTYNSVQLIDDILIVPGGELAKNNEGFFTEIVQAIDKNGIDRHSYIAVVGGGAVLDLVGYAAAVAHRGIKHVRIPTTVLSQNDSGIGVKNGINFFGKKNFLGTFAPPFAVFNDERFLLTLSQRHWRAGISEAIKVALIKDKEFFEWLEENAADLVARHPEKMNYLVWRCADLHMRHIGGTDPFETGSSRPLDFGHWSAHKLEQLSEFDVLHGEAVAIGIAWDTMYSHLSARLSARDANRVLLLLKRFGFSITHPLMQVTDGNSPILKGLEEFREHLGGQLTIMLLDAIGRGAEVHYLDAGLLKECGQQLAQFETTIVVD
jgi:3-dehydroquinate synthase